MINPEEYLKKLNEQMDSLFIGEGTWIRAKYTDGVFNAKCTTFKMEINEFVPIMSIHTKDKKFERLMKNSHKAQYEIVT